MYLKEIYCFYHIEYDLYKVIPVPIPHNVSKPNSYAMIIPTKNFVALSKDKSTYCTLDEINSCKSVSKGTIACDIPNIVSVDTNPICEIELMTKIITVLPTNCETKFIYGNIDIWQNLGRNNWIFVQSKPTKVSIECNSKAKDTSAPSARVPRTCAPLAVVALCVTHLVAARALAQPSRSYTCPYTGGSASALIPVYEVSIGPGRSCAPSC